MQQENITWKKQAKMIVNAVAALIDDFPEPIVQIEIYAIIPWLLQCNNDYLC